MFKNYTSLKQSIITLCVLTCLLSCNNEVKPIQFETESFTGTFASNIDVTLENAKGEGTLAKNINTTLESELAKMLPNSKNASTLKEALQSFDEDFKTFKSNFEDESQVWELNLETEVIYQSETIVTISLSSYIDTGGAHGNDVIKLLNFNPKTGKLYNTEALISNKFEFTKTAKFHFMDYVKNEGRDYAEFFFGEAFQLPKNIGLNDEGLILLYNVYEIASYSEGYTEITIPLEDALPFLKITP